MDLNDFAVGWRVLVDRVAERIQPNGKCTGSPLAVIGNDEPTRSLLAVDGLQQQRVISIADILVRDARSDAAAADPRERRPVVKDGVSLVDRGSPSGPRAPSRFIVRGDAFATVRIP